MSSRSQTLPELLDYHGVKVRSGRLGQQDCHVVDEVILHDGYKTRIRPNGEPGDVVVDVGAHIGSFSVLWHRKNPQARFACVEVAPENAPVLKANVETFAELIVQGACTYEPGKLFLLNSIKEGGTATGGSSVIREEEIGDATRFENDPIYRLDKRPIAKFSLEEIMRSMNVDRIDVLKLDCEGSEYSILENGPIERVRFICGEFHGGYDRWERFRHKHFSDWGYSIHHEAGGLGIFHLQNPNLER